MEVNAVTVEPTWGRVRARGRLEVPSVRNALAALVLAMKCEQGLAQVVVLEEELVTSKSLWIRLMMIIILFLLAVGCWSGWRAHEVVVKWVAQREPTLPVLEGHVHAHLDAEAQTIELGLNPELALRGPITAKLTQRCQRCGSPIHLGDWIREFHVGVVPREVRLRTGAGDWLASSRNLARSAGASRRGPWRLRTEPLGQDGGAVAAGVSSCTRSSEAAVREPGCACSRANVQACKLGEVRGSQAPDPGSRSD